VAVAVHRKIWHLCSYAEVAVLVVPTAKVLPQDVTVAHIRYNRYNINNRAEGCYQLHLGCLETRFVVEPVVALLVLVAVVVVAITMLLTPPEVLEYRVVVAVPRITHLQPPPRVGVMLPSSIYIQIPRGLTTTNSFLLLLYLPVVPAVVLLLVMVAWHLYQLGMRWMSWISIIFRQN